MYLMSSDGENKTADCTTTDRTKNFDGECERTGVPNKMVCPRNHFEVVRSKGAIGCTLIYEGQPYGYPRQRVAAGHDYVRKKHVHMHKGGGGL